MRAKQEIVLFKLKSSGHLFFEQFLLCQNNNGLKNSFEFLANVTLSQNFDLICAIFIGI